jgi:hypothetical protein
VVVLCLGFVRANTPRCKRNGMLQNITQGFGLGQMLRTVVINLGYAKTSYKVCKLEKTRILFRDKC